MRWRLIVITSGLAAIIAAGTWSAAVALLFGPARLLDIGAGLWTITSVIPVTLSATAALFVYRHTARKRKSQAAVAGVIALLLAVGGYFVASKALPNYMALGLPNPETQRPQVEH